MIMNTKSVLAFLRRTRESRLSRAVVLVLMLGTLTAIPTTVSAQLAYAHVQADGTIDRGSGNITVVKSGSGSYCVGVTGGTAQLAVVSLDSLPNVGGTVQAGTYWASGCPETANNVHVVTRPQAQDGGTPGEDRAFYITVAGEPLIASNSSRQGPVGAKIRRHGVRIPTKMRRDRMAATAARREPLG